MDSSLKSTHLAADESMASLKEHVEEAGEEHHVHLPNPSLWPFILSGAILVTIIGLMFLPSNPWLSIIGAPFVLVGILGWGLEDPMAPIKAAYITPSAGSSGIVSRFLLGQQVLDNDGAWLGTVQARFDRYILVERGGLFVTALYVPMDAIEEEIKNNVVRLTVNEHGLLERGLDSVPNDLYNEVPEIGMPSLKGVPMFAHRPLSPAQTGHYNYGPNYPGINTDASGSYHREEVSPRPQRYVGERRKKAVS